MLRSTEVLHSIAALHAASGELGRNRFRAFVQLALKRQPELQALSWNPRVPAGQRDRLEAEAAADGAPGFRIRELEPSGRLVPARTRDGYVPVYLIEPLAKNQAALGFDLGSDPSRRIALEEARDSGVPVATAPIHLAQEAQDHAGLLVLLPVYQGPMPADVAGRREKWAGFAVAVFRVADLVGDAFRELESKGIEARLTEGGPAAKTLFGADALASRDRASTWLEFASRRWAVEFAPTARFETTRSHLRSWFVLGGGLASTVLASAYLSAGARRTAEIAAAHAALHEEVEERQRAEAAAAAANEAKSGFLASMSHEIRTPLNAILGYTQLLQRDPRVPPEQRDALGGISASGHHLLGLIDEILDLSKIEAGRMELNVSDFDIASLVRGLTATFQPLCAAKRVAFRVGLDAQGPLRVRGDEGKLRQVLINLLGNAVKFTNQGEVCLRSRKADGDGRIFEVIDTGLGIPDDEQADIFRPFHQGSGSRDRGGTGLGLAIAQRQVELLGGRLGLQSERGVGSRFYFTIPLAVPATAPEDPVPQVLRLAAGHEVRALVVDDRKENCDVLGGMLALIGCEVRTAADGPAALRAAAEFRPGIVFLDLLLPGMGGAEAARLMLADPACGGPKIVAHTASALARMRDEAFAAGCVDFVAKPFRCERIHEMVRVHLGVAFEHAALQPEELPAAVLSRVVLPDELSARLHFAAELHSTTALKSCLQDLRELGPDATQLAEQIRHRMRSFDMDGILRLLTTATSPEPSTPLHHGISR